VEGAYFVGRKEIIDWVNKACSLNMGKVEETASGCAACMLLDQLYPGQVPMSKVNWNAKQSFEYVGNYKILQDSFSKLKIDRHIDVDRLISGRYMDNLEFMQWFKRYYEITSGSTERPENYNATESRCKGKGGKEYGKGKATVGGGGAKRTTSAPGQDARVAARKKAEEEGRQLGRANSAKNTSTAGAGSKTVTSAEAPAALNSPPRAGAGHDAARISSSAAIVANKALVAEVQTLKNEITNIKSDMTGLEKERDFYFDKLRDIEIYLQDMEEEGILAKSTTSTTVSGKIFSILYATADGFVQSPSAQSQASHSSKKPSSIQGSVNGSLLGNIDNGNDNNDDDDDNANEDTPISPVKYSLPPSNNDEEDDEDVPPPPEDDEDNDNVIQED
jgi:microtubule-associated protein, RP/EB family